MIAVADLQFLWQVLLYLHIQASQKLFGYINPLLLKSVNEVLF